MELKAAVLFSTPLHLLVVEVVQEAETHLLQVLQVDLAAVVHAHRLLLLAILQQLILRKVILAEVQTIMLLIIPLVVEVAHLLLDQMEMPLLVAVMVAQDSHQQLAVHP